jgi:UDP-4-amino-4,6-dideoxy-N-acetyl-beta-L-altrosamine transaminase
MSNLFLPYGRQCIEDDDVQAVVATLTADYLAQGPQVEQMEATICKITGARYCVVMSSATACLHLAVTALGLPPGSEGITTPITFVATSNSLIYNGLVPRFADIDSRTYCIDPGQVERQITDRTRVLLPVDFAGQPANMARIRGIADAHGLKVIEDAAHAIGSVYPGGARVGSCLYSDMTIFSFHPVKTVTTGEGGAVTTNDKGLYDRLTTLRSHGIIKEPELIADYPGPWYQEMDELGFNYRMTDIQAALGNSQLKKLERFKARRRQIMVRYNEAFKGMRHLTTPFEAPGADTCFHLYVVLIDFAALGTTRRDVMAQLTAAGVGTQVHYIPVVYQPYYKTRYFTRRGDFPVADAYYDRALSLPFFPRMDDEDVEKVIRTVRRVVG